MVLEKIILRCVLGILSKFYQLRPIDEKKISMISMTQDHLSGDLKYLYDALIQEDVHIHLVLMRYQGGWWQKFLYFLNCIQQLKAVYTSKVILITDNNYVISNYKREGVIVIQLWHASGAIKKFGNAIKREYEIKNYDYIICTSPVWKEPYAQAFHVKPEQVLPLGLPHIDELFCQDHVDTLKRSILERCPLLKGHYVVLYAPTFRGNIIDGMTSPYLDIEKIMKSLPKDVIFLYKFHPLLKNVQLPYHERVVNMNQEDLYSLLSVCDCLITDYSSVIFDASILKMKLVFFAPDITQYDQDRGFYIDYHHQTEIPLCFNEDQLITLLKQRTFDLQKIDTFRNRYFYNQDGKSLDRIVSLIKTVMKGDTYV